MKQAVGGRPPRYAPAQACKWWHDIRHVRVWIGHHYCMSMLACQYNQPKRPGDLDLWPFDPESGARVTCDVGYLCANFSLPRPLCSRVMARCTRQTDVRQRRQTDVRQKHRLMPRLLGAGAVVRRSQKFRPAADHLPGARDNQNLISWRWSLPLPTNPVWWGSMHAISSYHGNRPTNKHTHKQTGPITIHCAAAIARNVIDE